MKTKNRKVKEKKKKCIKIKKNLNINSYYNSYNSNRKFNKGIVLVFINHMKTNDYRNINKISTVNEICKSLFSLKIKIKGVIFVDENYRFRRNIRMDHRCMNIPTLFLDSLDELVQSHQNNPLHHPFLFIGECKKEFLFEFKDDVIKHKIPKIPKIPMNFNI